MIRDSNSVSQGCKTGEPENIPIFPVLGDEFAKASTDDVDGADSVTSNISWWLSQRSSVAKHN